MLLITTERSFKVDILNTTGETLSCNIPVLYSRVKKKGIESTWIYLPAVKTQLMQPDAIKDKNEKRENTVQLSSSCKVTFHHYHHMQTNFHHEVCGEVLWDPPTKNRPKVKVLLWFWQFGNKTFSYASVCGCCGGGRGDAQRTTEPTGLETTYKIIKPNLQPKLWVQTQCPESCVTLGTSCSKQTAPV